MNDIEDKKINIEEIMRDIREEILAQRQGNGPKINISGRRFPPEFYEHLYQAALAYDELPVQMHLTPINVPLIGGLLQTVRQKIHEVVLFYVNQLAENQTRVNKHLLQAIDVLAKELDEQDNG